MDSLFALLGFLFICLLIIAANQQAAQHSTGGLIKFLLTLLVGMMALIGALTLVSALSPQADSPSIELSTALAFFTATMLASLCCLALIFSQAFRRFIQHFIFRTDGLSRYYEADSWVHTTALVIIAFAILNTIGNFVLAGGVEGMATSLQETNIGVSDLFLNMALYLTGALLGVGLVLRRNLKKTLERVGLIFSIRQNLQHILIGAIVGFGLFWVQVALSLVWQSMVSPETLTEQTAAAQEIFSAFSGSLWLGFLVAITAGIGEEILFRGALQPIFGNLAISLFFVLLHSQYILTPASLIILVVSLVFGLLRQNYSTNASITAHFVYNFSPFLLLYLATQTGLSF